MRQKPSEQKVKDRYFMRVKHHSEEIRFSISLLLTQVGRAIGPRSIYRGDEEPTEEIPLDSTLTTLCTFEKTLENELRRYEFFKTNATQNQRVQTPQLTQHFQDIDTYIRFAQETLQQFYKVLDKHKEAVEE